MARCSLQQRKKRGEKRIVCESSLVSPRLASFRFLPFVFVSHSPLFAKRTRIREREGGGMIPPIRVEKRDRSPRPIRPRLLNHRHVYSIRRYGVKGSGGRGVFKVLRLYAGDA